MKALLYDGKISKAQEVEVYRTSNGLELRLSENSRFFASNEIRAEAPMEGMPFRLYLEGGEKLELPRGQESEALHKQFFSRSSGIIKALEANVRLALICSAFVIIIFIAVVTQGAPLMGEYGAQAMPQTWIERSDVPLFSSIEERYLSPSKLGAEKQAKLTSLFKDLSHRELNIHFRSAPLIGANAFAIGGKTIVFTDQLIEKMPEDQLQAVFLHELGHLEKRHMLAQVISAIGVNALAMMIMGDMTGLTESLANIGLTITALKHSRDFESEADIFAVKKLKDNNLGPELMEKALISLKGINKGPQGMEFLSTHPAVDSRIKKLQKLYK